MRQDGDEVGLVVGGGRRGRGGGGEVDGVGVVGWGGRGGFEEENRY